MPAEREVQFAVKDESVACSHGLPLFVQFKHRAVIDPVFEVRTGHVPEFVSPFSAAALVMAAVVKIENMEKPFVGKSDHITDPCIETIRRVIGDRNITENVFLFPFNPAQIVGEAELLHIGKHAEFAAFVFMVMLDDSLGGFAVHNFTVAEDLEINAVKKQGDFVLFFLIFEQGKGKADPPRTKIALHKEKGFQHPAGTVSGFCRKIVLLLLVELVINGIAFGLVPCKEFQCRRREDRTIQTGRNCLERDRKYRGQY